MRPDSWQPSSWQFCVVSLCFALVFAACGQTTNSTTPSSLPIVPRRPDVGSCVPLIISPRLSKDAVAPGDGAAGDGSACVSFGPRMNKLMPVGTDCENGAGGLANDLFGHASH